MVNNNYKKHNYIMILGVAFILTGCGNTQLANQTEIIEDEINNTLCKDDFSYSVVSENHHELTKKDITVAPTKWGDLPDEYEYCLDAVDDINIYLEESHDDENGDMIVSFSKINLETKEISSLYTPTDWSMIFDPILIDGNLIVEIIKSNNVTNNLAYEITSISDEGTIITLCSGNSCYYPLLSKTDTGFSLLSFTYKENGVEENLFYYDFPHKKLMEITNKSYILHGEESIGDEIHRSCGENREILYNVSTYDHEISQEGSNGTHLLYHYSLDDNSSSLLDFQPGYLCDYFMTDGNAYLIEKTDTTNSLIQSGYIYLHTGSEYDKWIVPPVTPVNSIKQAEFIKDNVICVQLTSGIMLIDLKDMTYWYKESFSTAYTKDKIWYSDNENIYYINIDDIVS